MKTTKKTALALLTVSLAMTLAACGGAKNGATKKVNASNREDFSVALVTDLGGVDDKSFNQSAWEGLQNWGKKSNKDKGTGGYTYFQSNSDSEFTPNLNSAIDDGFNTIFGIGFKLQPALEEVAIANPDKDFVIIDSVVENQDNVLSVLFKANESSYLAGIAAAKTTKTNEVAFIGGQEGAVIELFEAGFAAGVASVDKDIKVHVKYAGSFGDAALGKSIAAAMYKSGVDVIFHAAGDTGNGVFSEAIDFMKTKPETPVWVIGVDRDQQAEGEYDGGNVTLTSALKSVAAVTQSISADAEAGNFPGGTTQVYGLKDDGVDCTDGQLSDDIIKDIQDAKEKIIAGDIEVPETAKQ